MKKRTFNLFIIPVIVVVLAIAALGAWFLFGRDQAQGDTTEETDSAEANYIVEERSVVNLLGSLDVQQIQAAAEEEGFEIEVADGYNVVTVDPYDNMVFQAIFSVSDDRVTELVGSFEVKTPASQLEEADEISGYVGTVVSVFNELFDYQVTDGHYHICGLDGLPLEIDDPETYEKLAKDEATFALYVRDGEDTIWRIRGDVLEGSLVFSYARYIDSDYYDEFPVDLTVSVEY